MAFPWQREAPKREYQENVELLRKLQPYADASGEELYHFMLRVHITNGEFCEDLKSLRPRTIENIKTFLRNAPPTTTLNEKKPFGGWV